MLATTVNNFIVRKEQTPGLGAPWMVKVYKKVFFFKRRVSADWFLDGAQAGRFYDQIVSELASGDTESLLRNRPPGWTLRRPTR